MSDNRSESSRNKMSRRDFGRITGVGLAAGALGAGAILTTSPAKAAIDPGAPWLDMMTGLACATYWIDGRALTLGGGISVASAADYAGGNSFIAGTPAPSAFGSNEYGGSGGSTTYMDRAVSNASAYTGNFSFVCRLHLNVNANGYILHSAQSAGNPTVPPVVWSMSTLQIRDATSGVSRNVNCSFIGLGLSTRTLGISYANTPSTKPMFPLGTDHTLYSYLDGVLFKTHTITTNVGQTMNPGAMATEIVFPGQGISSNYKFRMNASYPYALSAAEHASIHAYCVDPVNGL